MSKEWVGDKASAAPKDLRDEFADDMIERVARAMCQSALGGKVCPCTQSGKFNCREAHPWHQAIAAIKSMCKPTDEMVDAVREIGGPQAAAYAIAAWPTMIDAALGEAK